MANFIIQRPSSHCHAAEIRLAEYLRELDERWTVVWGYFYTDRKGNDREGDFLVMGPAGGILVLEAKERMPRWYSATGEWEGEATSPLDQLMDQWGSIMRMLKKEGIRVWATKAICIPTELASLEVSTYQGVKRSALVLKNDLQHWLRTWLRLFDEKVRQPVMPDARDAVLELFGASVTPASRQAFLAHTEQLFARQLSGRFHLLHQLRNNRQLLVRGGTGTGKTWHALEQAVRYARAGEGKDVLLLVYNLALASHLGRMVEMRQIEAGRITVMSWEVLFRQLAATHDEELPEPDASDPEELEKFFELSLPSQVLMASQSSEAQAKWPQFDALVVDEAQDHDTTWHPQLEQGAGLTCGWWSIYLMLLREGEESPASIFYDPAQRPPFRDRNRFELDRLAGVWSQPAHVNLRPALRYTRPIWSYLTCMNHEAVQPLADGLGRGDELPEGPDPEEHCCTDAELAGCVEEIISNWQKKGLCEPEEVLILHKSSRINQTPLGACEALCGRSLKEVADEEAPSDSIRHTSINKAKGLDSKAVILTGLADLNDPSADVAYNWFMGSSRARQLLAVVTVEKEG